MIFGVAAHYCSKKSYYREFRFQRQVVSRPKVRVAGRIEDRNRPVTIELDFEDPVRRIKGSLRALRHHRGNKGWEGFLRHIEGSQRKAIMSAANISKLVLHPALVAKRQKCCMINPDVWYQTPPTFVAG